MNKQKIEEIGKEFVEKVLNFSFNSMAEKTNANRLLKAFVAGAEAVSAGVEAISKQVEVKDKEPAVEIDVTKDSIGTEKEYHKQQMERASRLRLTPQEIEEVILGQAPMPISKPKTEQKVCFTSSESLINILLNDGWKVLSATPVHVSASNHYGREGNICFVLEREV